MLKRKLSPRSLSLSLGLLVLALLVISRPSLTAQGAEPAEPVAKEAAEAAPASFENASVASVLNWASKEINAGFLYSPEKFTAESLGTMTYRPAQAATNNEKRILLYESLRELGLVPMPVRGMASEVYRVVPIDEAAQLSEVSEYIEDLEGYYFGTIAFRARVMPFETLVALIAQHSSKSAKTIAVKETSTIIVSDFIDALHNIDDALYAADRKTPRPDDAISYVYPVEKHDPETLVRQVLKLRVGQERYQAAHQRGTRVIVLSGPRADVEAASHRLDLMEAADSVENVQLNMHTLTTLVIEADDLYRSLQTYFAEEVSAQHIRFASIPQRDQVLVNCNEADWKRVQAVVREFDRLPANTEEERATKRVEDRRAFVEPKEHEIGVVELPKKPANEPEKQPEGTPEKAPE